MKPPTTKKQKKVKKNTKQIVATTAILNGLLHCTKKCNVLKTIAVLLFIISFLPAKAIDGRLMVTTFPNFFERWYQSHTELPMAHIPLVRQVYKRQVFYMLPVITGFSTKNGKTNVQYNIFIKQGNTVLFSRKAVTGLKKTVLNTASVFLCETVLNYEFSNTASNGEYSIEIEVIDYIAHDTAILVEKLQVNPYTFNERRFTSADSFFVWQNYYYEGFGLDREIDGLLFFSFPQMQTNAEKTLSLLAYFAVLFKDKNYLLQAVDAIFLTRNKDERLSIIHILHLAGYMPQSFQNKFTDKEKKYYADLKGYGLPTIPHNGIKNHILLNMQWARFFATGGLEYAKSITQTCELAKYAGALTRFNTSAKTEKDKQEAFLETVYQKNQEHLFKRLPNHPLFNGYCKYLMQGNELSNLAKQELKKVIVP